MGAPFSPGFKDPNPNMVQPKLEAVLSEIFIHKLLYIVIFVVSLQYVLR